MRSWWVTASSNEHLRAWRLKLHVQDAEMISPEVENKLRLIESLLFYNSELYLILNLWFFCDAFAIMDLMGYQGSILNEQSVLAHLSLNSGLSLILIILLQHILLIIVFSFIFVTVG